MIDVLVPVLSRPQNAQPLADSLRRHTKVETRLLFLTSPGDTEQFDACLKTGADVLEVRGTMCQYPRKINAGFKWTHHPYVLLAADDVEFRPGWDTVALAAAESGKGVIGTNDLTNPNVIRGIFSTHPLVRRTYIAAQGGSLDGPGSILHEGYDHNFCDRELCALAVARDEWVFAAKSVIRHINIGDRRTESTYQKGLRNFRRDEQVFLRRAPAWGSVGLLDTEIHRVGRQVRARPRQYRPPRPGRRR